MTDESHTDRQQYPDRQHWEAAHWVQLNVGLVRHYGSALLSSRALFAHIKLFVNQWRSAGWLGCFFFMRKPPDVRMRFLIVAHKQEVITELSAQMLDLQRQGFINQFFFSDYQAETDRFGGLEAMKCVHSYFDKDTSNWLALDQLCQQNLRVAFPEMLLPAVFQDLFQRTLCDEISVLRTWYSLGSLTPLYSGTTVPEVDVLSIETLCSYLAVTGKEASILYGYTQANNSLAQELTDLCQSHQLSCTLFDVLATIALFNFNRHGFPGERSAVIVAGMMRSLERRISGMNYLLSPW